MITSTSFQPRREQIRKTSNVLAPVIDLKSKKEEEDSNSNSSFSNLAKVSKNYLFIELNVLKIVGNELILNSYSILK